DWQKSAAVSRGGVRVRTPYPRGALSWLSLPPDVVASAKVDIGKCVAVFLPCQDQVKIAWRAHAMQQCEFAFAWLDFRGLQVEIRRGAVLAVRRLKEVQLAALARRQ